MTGSNDPIQVLVVALSPTGPSKGSRSAVTAGLKGADERFTVEFESVTDIDETLALCERGAVDCVVLTGISDGPSLNLLGDLGERRPELPRIYAVESGGDSDAEPVADALAAGATDVVDVYRDEAVARVLAHRIGNAVEASRAVSESDHHQRRLDRFVSGVSHDLRNPLNVAQGRLELARETGESEHLDTAAVAVDRTLELIEDLLTLAKQGETPDELERVDLREIAETSRSHVDTGEATLSVETDQRIVANPSRLKQLLENLFGNAVTHGGDGVAVVVGEVSPMYTTTRAGNPKRNGFYVADDGPGIPDELRDDVFEIGYTTNDDGTGFGLNIVQEIAAAHGWTVAVTEGAQGGARFDITGVDIAE